MAARQWVLVLVTVCIVLAALAAGADDLVSTLRQDNLLVAPQAAPEAARQNAWKACPQAGRPPPVSSIPTWARRSLTELRKLKNRRWRELTFNDGFRKGTPTGAFAAGGQIVLKQCTAAALNAAVRAVQPRHGKLHKRDPKRSIIFDCGSKKQYVIPLQSELKFGAGSGRLRGSYRLVAPKRNVILDGKRRTRIMVTKKRTRLVVYGITFRNGKARVKGRTKGQNASGSGLLCGTKSTCLVNRCKFTNNSSVWYFSRFAGGGAIKAEAASRVTVWNSSFKGNTAAVGGAIATSSAQILFIVNCEFEDNTAVGGVDQSSLRKRNARLARKVKLPIITVQGGAIRVDSTTGHQDRKEHVLLCNTSFVRNSLYLKHDSMKKRFPKYNPSSSRYISGRGAAVYAWNSEGKLNAKTGNRHFITLRNVSFKRNFEQMHLRTGWNGAFALMVNSAGHVNLNHVLFSHNRVQRAIASLDNSERFQTTKLRVKWQMRLRNVKFRANSPKRGISFEQRGNSSRCWFYKVEGVRNGKRKNCRKWYNQS